MPGMWLLPYNSCSLPRPLVFLPPCCPGNRALTARGPPHVPPHSAHLPAGRNSAGTHRCVLLAFARARSCLLFGQPRFPGEGLPSETQLILEVTMLVAPARFWSLFCLWENKKGRWVFVQTLTYLFLSRELRGSREVKL